MPELILTMFSAGVGSAAKLGGLKLYNIAKPITLKSSAAVVSATKTFVKTHDFKSPLTFKLESGRLNSGIPFDAIKLQKPVVRKGAGGKDSYKGDNLGTEGVVAEPSGVNRLNNTVTPHDRLQLEKLRTEYRQ